jgi:Fe-Mn family superoxide dismutase
MSISREERAAETWEDDGGRTVKSNSGAERDKKTFTASFNTRQFNIPELKGISRKNVEEHLELYKGYVKFSNHIVQRIHELPKDDENSAYELSLLQRRFAYEHDGMKNHELFFEQFEGGPAACASRGPFSQQSAKDFGSFDALVSCLKGVAMTRGVGWVMLYYCRESGRLFPQWVDEHHIGLLTGPKIVFALDMWEHAFIYDYATSEKKKYVEAFFANLNWGKVESRFAK